LSINLKIYTLLRRLSNTIELLWNNFLLRVTFVPLYYTRNELIWQDGFLFDFLQKKTTDLWVRKFLIYTGFLFSERLVFESVVRLYIDNLIWLGHSLNTFESSNVSEMLNTLIFIIVTITLLIFSLAILFI